MPDALGTLSPSARSPHVGVWCGAQNSHSCRWVSVNQLVSSLWSFPPWRYGVVYIVKSPLLPLDVASSCSSGVGYLFLRFLVQLGADFSAFSCEFCCFRREVELQSFYSAILIPFPTNIYWTLLCKHFVCINHLILTTTPWEAFSLFWIRETKLAPLKNGKANILIQPF